jgi:hypothetical protein
VLPDEIEIKANCIGGALPNESGWQRLDFLETKFTNAVSAPLLGYVCAADLC